MLDIISNFYTNLTELFVKKPIETPSRIKSMDGIQSKTIGIQKGDENSDKIIERFRKIINKPEEIPITGDIPVIEDKSTPFYENKYIIIGGILILSGLAWYFYDDLKPYGSAVLAWINSKRHKPDPDSDNVKDIANNIINNPTASKSKLQSLKDSVFNKFKKDDDGSNKNSDSIKSIDLEDKTVEDKGKTIDFNNLSLSEKERRGITDLKNVNMDKEDILKGLPPITGERDKFINEGTSILAEMKALKLATEKGFPNKTLEKGLFSITKERFQKLSYSNPDLFKTFIKDETANNCINEFFDLENNLYPKEVLQDIKPEENLPEIIKSPTSDTYNEVAMAAIEEQDHWSDKAMSPKPLPPIPDLFSPLKIPKSIPSEDKFSKVNEILKKAEKLDVKENENLKKVHWEDEIEEYLPESKDVNPVGEVKNPIGKLNLAETDKIVKSSNNPMGSLFDQIKILRNEKDVLPSPVKPKSKELESDPLSEQNNSNIVSTSSVANVGLQTPIVDKINPVPTERENKSSISNLFESFNNLFDDNPIDIDTDNNPGESSKLSEVKPDISDLIKDIKSQRKEYGTPLNSNKVLSEESSSDSSEDLEESSKNKAEVEISSINWKDEIKFDIYRGDIKDRFIEFKFGDNFDKLQKIYIITNDGGGQYIDVHINKSSNQSIKWDNKGISNPDHKELDIFKIYVMDNVKPKLSQEIYTNPNAKILESFHTNSVGRSY